MDDPAQAMMAEPRMLHTQDTEATWWRLVDVPRALAQRGYNREARLIVEVQGDDLAPWNNGRWLLQTAGDAGEESIVSSTELSPDITLSIRGLSGLFSGMYSAQTLANWGMLSGQPDDIFAASGVFATKYGPHCPDHY
jgi:predicted acetyltransferase